MEARVTKVARVSTRKRYFLPFLLRAPRLAPGRRVLDVATGTGIAAEAALGVQLEEAFSD
jgi:ubiquinone/menaquinone biosynthesis C-methylase UbiE